MTTFNNFFNTDFTTYNNNGLESFKTLLESKGLKQTRADWFQCGSVNSVKYTYKNEKNYVSFSFGNDNRIEVGNYKLN